jgi:hypothetical protein
MLRCAKGHSLVSQSINIRTIPAMQVEETSTLLAQKNKLQAAWQHRVPAASK